MGEQEMKLEQNDKSIMFATTQIPDIFFAEYLSNMPGDYLKIYLYLNFLSKYNGEININDLSKKLAIPINTINEGMKYLEKEGFILRKQTGFIVVDLQEKTLNNLYTLKIQTSEEKIEQNAKNKERIRLIEYLNNKYFQGVMGPTWYTDIDTWFDKYGFDEQVMINLFDYCYTKSALHKNYVQTVAEAWGLNKIKNLDDLDNYYMGQEKLMKIKKEIAKKLGRRNGLTQYEEAYIETWVNEYKYDLSIIEIALKRTTLRSNASFEYINNIIKDWNDRNLRTPIQVNEFLEQRKKQNKDTKELQKQVKKESFEQRTYSNLNFLYANKNIEGAENGN
jgi:DnaD/phage-associated family protein